MTVPAVLLPLFVQVGLTFVLMFWMGSTRLACIRAGETKVRDIALGQSNWPAGVQQISNAYASQFEMPILFYVLTALALITRKADLLFVVMAWLFVATRIIHAVIHTTANRVSHRFYAFVAGSVILLLMWIIFAVRILLGL